MAGLDMTVTFEQLRIPVAALLLVVALFVLWPRDDAGLQANQPSPSVTIVVGEAGGEVVADPTATPPPVTPSPSVAPTTSPTPEPTPEPPDTFSAEVLACRDIDGSRCRGEFERFPRRGDSFTALVRFEDARAGDTISVTLTGPGVEISGGPFTLQGGGDGYYYSEITYGDLADGDYVLSALRNGVEVASVTLRED
jgi:hypothetical protein